MSRKVFTQLNRSAKTEPIFYKTSTKPYEPKNVFTSSASVSPFTSGAVSFSGSGTAGAVASSVWVTSSKQQCVKKVIARNAVTTGTFSFVHVYLFLV